MSTLVMNQRIVWDATHKKQVEEAKQEFLKFKREGYLITDDTGRQIEHFRPHFEELIIVAQGTKKSCMKILSESGDDRIIWDMNNGKEAKEAKAKFVELMKKGYKAYSVDSKGKKNRRIEEFDVEAEEILMVPPTAKG